MLLIHIFLCYMLKTGLSFSLTLILSATIYAYMYTKLHVDMCTIGGIRAKKAGSPGIFRSSLALRRYDVAHYTHRKIGSIKFGTQSEDVANIKPLVCVLNNLQYWCSRCPVCCIYYYYFCFYFTIWFRSLFTIFQQKSYYLRNILIRFQ